MQKAPDHRGLARISSREFLSRSSPSGVPAAAKSGRRADCRRGGRKADGRKHVELA